MKQLLSTTLFLAVILTLSACSKKEIEPLSNVEIITSSAWKITKWTVDPQIVDPDTEEKISDVTHIIKECHKDDIYKFGKEFNYQFESGSNLCYQDEPQINASGTWDIGESGKNLYLMGDYSSYTSTYEIETLEPGKMKLSYEILYDGNLIKLIEHYVHSN